MSSLISVDIQPSYASSIYWLDDYIQYLADFDGPILYLFNGQDLGMEDTRKVQDWLLYHAVDILDVEQLEKFQYKVLNEIEFVEKGYAFFRETMEAGWDDLDMISLAKYMRQNRIQDARDLDFDELREQGILDDDQVDDLESGYLFYIPETIEAVQGWGGSILVGGGINECLAEVELLMEILDEPYTVDSRFTY
jgi:hypothetical protein